MFRPRLSAFDRGVLPVALSTNTSSRFPPVEGLPRGLEIFPSHPFEFGAIGGSFSRLPKSRRRRLVSWRECEMIKNLSIRLEERKTRKRRSYHFLQINDAFSGWTNENSVIDGWRLQRTQCSTATRKVNLQIHRGRYKNSWIIFLQMTKGIPKIQFTFINSESFLEGSNQLKEWIVHSKRIHEVKRK